ncbi:carboxy-S-adenosyl-L-methionine synthase CmoA [Candidatus Enterovibrio escicola]|uniref:Carboxy-S-adenosyl-L-methionine synthase n=1 Tax=Candidatus Enterovibrio escicola TaxID=1927127 RepID=A0A2A5T2H3_9GAMM|nr:carboxy-S-adenosyl-L-methionine synthase CmoA [Candidatus Enterovibrio escacola]PCS22367.1 tRNA (uridine-5-oxyacetic acid methyl ester) 34 synthase [Candidatus Enterovibrio escacola]
MANRDNIYAAPIEDLDNFTFDENVAEVFPDMIQRSVPNYRYIISAIGMLAERYASEGSNIYDLGCSLGAITLSIRQQLKVSNCRIIAVDNSPAMVERCRLLISAYHDDIKVYVIENDIRNIDIKNASVVVLNFTLQFLNPDDRQSLLEGIYSGLKMGAILILSEKYNFSDKITHQLLNDLHFDFKRANGYSDLEIRQKHSALENVMKLDTIDYHIQRLNRIGFSSVSVWFQCFNFGSIFAIK